MVKASSPTLPNCRMTRSCMKFLLDGEFDQSCNREIAQHAAVGREPFGRDDN